MQRLYEAISVGGECFDEKVRSILSLGRETLGVESGLLSRIDGEEYHAEIVEGDPGPFEVGTAVPLSETRCERVVTTESSVRIEDASTDPGASADAGASAAEIACYVGAPVVVDGDVYGSLCFYDRNPRSEPFSDWDATLVDLMARWVGNELDRQRATAEVARERDRFETFASMVSHDLRNPLNVATGRLDLAREEHDSPNLERSAEALDRMAELIEDALSFARLGSRGFDLEAVDLSEVGCEAWTTVDTRDATLSLGTPGVIAGDRSRVRTLFENLFRNAVEHGGDDVSVVIDRGTGGFYVADDGPGIPEEVRDTVFEIGYSSTDTGTGFGLGIVKQIADAHGWSITVGASESGGARFDIRGVSHVPGVTTRAR